MHKTSLSWWAALGGLGGLAFCSSAVAQDAQTSSTSYSIVDTPSIAQAPPSHSVNATVEGLYQTDVAGGDAAVAAARGLKRDDFIITPTVLGQAFQPLGRESVFIAGSVAYNFYDRNPILNREALDLSGGVNGQLSLCRATVTGGYDRHQTELQDVTIGQSKVQDTLSTASVGLNGACGRGYGFSPTFSVSQSWTDNSLALFSSSNFQTLGGSGGLSYQQPTFGSLSLYGQYQTTDFTNRILVINLSPTHDEIDSYGGGVRYVRQLGARIQGTVSLSYTAVTSNTNAVAPFNGVTYGADVTFRASSRLMFHVNFLRDVQPSHVLNTTYYIETKNLVEATYAAGSRLKFDLGVSEQDRTFKGPNLTPTADLTSDTFKSIYGTATYSLRKVYFALDLRNDERRANLAGLTYPDTRIGLTAGTKF